MLNPKAWSDPADGQWGHGAAYYSDYRNRRQPDEQMSIGRIFRLRETDDIPRFAPSSSTSSTGPSSLL